MQRHKEIRQELKRNHLSPRAALILLALTCALTHRVSAQSDPAQIMQRFTDLQQQMAAAPDPCPLMPKLKALIIEIANQSPEVYQAMKPSLDLINQDDTCTDSNAAASPSGVGAASPRPPAENTDNAKSTGNQICPPSGFVPGVMQQVASDVAEGIQCTPGQPIATGNSSGGVNGSPGHSSSNSGGSSGSSGISGIPAECRDMDLAVHMVSQWHDAQKTDAEVVGYLSNDTVSDATCTWAFHKNGQWGDFGTLTVKAGQQHYGGEGGGIWTMGADSSDMKYICFAGIDPVDVHGRSCFANIKFAGQTRAGTDK